MNVQRVVKWSLGLLVLAACAGCSTKPLRTSVNWQNYNKPDVGATVRVEGSQDTVASTVRTAASKVGLRPLVANDELGIYSFSKVDDRYSNVSWVLNVSISESSDGGPQIGYRAFGYSISGADPGSKKFAQPIGGPKIFPSDGKLEGDFNVALSRSQPRSAVGDPGDKSGDSILGLLPKSWLVRVQGDARMRKLVVLGMTQAGQGNWTLDARYGWADAEPTPIWARLGATPSGYRIELVTQANSRINVESRDTSTFAGTFQPRAGAAKPVVLDLVMR